MTKCKNAARHWFAYYGWVGSSAPTCQHCNAPNPNYRPEDDIIQRRRPKMAGT